MKTDNELLRDMNVALKWEPLLRDAHLDVAVSSGVVTISGSVDSYAKRMAIAGAARNMTGAISVMESIEVAFKNVVTKDDGEVAVEVGRLLQSDPDINGEQIVVRVINAWVFLSGEVKWDHQKDAAKQAISDVAGVRGVTNHINVSPKEITHPELM